MRILQTTLFAIALAAITLAGCGGTSKNNEYSPGAGAMQGGDAYGGKRYGGGAADKDKAPDPCADDAKNDPCSGDE